jgi:hypothetical protein
MEGILARYAKMVEVAYPLVCRNVANQIKTSSEGFWGL